MAGRKKKKKGMTNVMIGGIVFVLVLTLSVQIVRLYNKNQEYMAKETSLQNELSQEEERQAELEEQEQYMNSQEFVEDEAKTKLGLVYDDEIIFKEK